MINRNQIKTCLYQNLIQSEELRFWFVTNFGYSEESIAEFVKNHIYESGENIPSDSLTFPAIRYKVVDDSPEHDYDDSCGVINLTFDIYIYSAKEDTKEADELLDLIRRIFRAEHGRSIGTFTESDAYETLVGENMIIQTWEFKEIGTDQIRAQQGEMSGEIRRGNDFFSGGVSVFTMVRLSGPIAEG